ncbi:MAG: hypothetical protein PVI69_01835 [Desulfobacterales bacterium]|jgi:hypothetical protein
MVFPDRRRYLRVATSSLVSYFLINKKGGIGAALFVTVHRVAKSDALQTT